MSRGAIYIIWDEKKSEKISSSLERSIDSLKKIGLEYKVCSGLDYSSKCNMYELSPFDETVFLDVDTVVLEDLSYGFEAAAKYHLALALAPAVFVTTHWKLNKIKKLKHLSNDIIEYNSGVMFFNKSETTRGLIEEWKRYSAIIAPKCIYCDQNALSVACWETGFNPHVLPMNWNYRPSRAKVPSFLFGSVKIWHGYEDVPEWVGEHNKRKKCMWGQKKKNI